MSHLFPCQIKNHLAKYLFQEFSGKEANIDCVKAKAVIIDANSDFGFFIKTSIQKHYDIKHINCFALFIRTIFENVPEKRLVESHLYHYRKEKKGEQQYQLLEVNEKAIKSVNDIIQFFFDIAIKNYINGALSDLAIEKSIMNFLEQYDLLSCNINTESLRRKYYRKKDDKNLDKLLKK